MYKEERVVLEEEMEKSSTLDRSEKAIAALRGRWWAQTAKQEGDKITKSFYVIHGKNVTSSQKAGGASIRSGKGDPSR